MKPTGIIRRIDDLGRVAIPKEIRRKLKIQEGNPLELYTTSEGVVLKKYCYFDDEFQEKSRIHASALYDAINVPIVICDNYKVIAMQGMNAPKSQWLNHTISEDVSEFIATGNSFNINKGKIKELRLFDHLAWDIAFLQPLKCNTDIVGAIVALKSKNKKLIDNDIKIINYVATTIIDTRG